MGSGVWRFPRVKHDMGIGRYLFLFELGDEHMIIHDQQHSIRNPFRPDHLHGPQIPPAPAGCCHSPPATAGAGTPNPGPAGGSSASPGATRLRSGDAPPLEHDLVGWRMAEFRRISWELGIGWEFHGIFGSFWRWSLKNVSRRSQ